MYVSMKMSLDTEPLHCGLLCLFVLCLISLTPVLCPCGARAGLARTAHHFWRALHSHAAHYRSSVRSTLYAAPCYLFWRLPAPNNVGIVRQVAGSVLHSCLACKFSKPLAFVRLCVRVKQQSACKRYAHAWSAMTIASIVNYAV
jgi:hypothetical protein